MKDYSAKPLSFDDFDPKWIAGLSFGRPMIGMRMMKSSRAAGVMMEESMATADMLEAPMAAPVMMAAKAAPQNTALQGRIAGYSVEDSEDEAGAVDGGSSANEALSAAPTSLRTNFNETAAFLPRLHSDPATGEVTLSSASPTPLTSSRQISRHRQLPARN